MILRRKSFIITLILIALTVGFIFFQSALPKEASAKESEAVGEVVEEIIETVAPNNQSLKDYVTKNIRKIAHFLEFGLLGGECAVLALVALRVKATADEVAKKRRFACALAGYAIAFGALIALLDESIQILSNRGPSVTDIWLDLFGFTALFAIVYAVILLVSARKKVNSNK